MVGPARQLLGLCHSLRHNLGQPEGLEAVRGAMTLTSTPDRLQAVCAQAIGVRAWRDGEINAAFRYLENARYSWGRLGHRWRERIVNRQIDRIRSSLQERVLERCPRCSGELVPLTGRLHRVCVACNMPVFWNQKVGAAALVTTDDAVLLVQRAMEPYKDWWVLPAGYVEYDETPHACVTRELAEETGLAIPLTPEPLSIDFFRDDPRADMIYFVYEGLMTGGSMSAGDDAKDAAFFTRDALPSQIAFAGNRRAIRRWVGNTPAL